MDQGIPGADAPAVVAPEVSATPETPAVVAPEPPAPRTYTEAEMAERTAKVERRVQKEMRDRMRAEVERDFLLKQSQPDKPKTPESGSKPVAKDYDDPAAFVEALADWKFEQRVKAETEQRQREQSSYEDRRQLAATAETLEAKFADAPKKYPDFRQVVIENEEAPMTYEIAQAIASSDVPVDLAYYLAHPDNLAHASKIARMSGVAQGREIAALEAKLKSTPVPLTQTPAPITPNGTKAAAQKDPAKMSDREFAEWRKRQIAQR